MEGMFLNSDNQEGSLDKMVEVKKQVKKLVGLMSEKIGVVIPETAYPEVSLAPDHLETSGYVSRANTIFLHQTHLDSGATYGEEVGHFIRHYLETINSLPEIEDYNFQMAVDEFFGRLGENISRDFSSDPDLKDIFKEEERDFLKGEEKYEELKERILETQKIAEKLKSVVEVNRELKMGIIEKVKKFHSSLEQAEETVKELEEQGVSLEELLNKMTLILEEVGNHNEELLSLARTILTPEGEYPQIAISLFKVLEDTKENVGRIKSLMERSKDEQSVDSYTYTIIKGYLFDTRSRCGLSLYELSNPDRDVRAYVRKMESYLYHVVGYAAAERFMQINPNWREELTTLYQETNDDIFNKFMESEEFILWLEGNKALAGLSERIEFFKEIEEALYISVDDISD